MKDNLIDEEKAKEEEAAQETTEQKLDRMGKISRSDADECENPTFTFAFRLQPRQFDDALLEASSRTFKFPTEN